MIAPYVILNLALTLVCFVSLYSKNFVFDVQDKFFSQLKSSADGFNVIAEFFGRGLLNNASRPEIPS